MTRCAFFTSLALVVALAACSGGGTVQKTFPPCDNTPSIDSQAHLVAPVSGTTGVSPTIGSITVAYGPDTALDGKLGANAYANRIVTLDYPRAVLAIR